MRQTDYLVIKSAIIATRFDSSGSARLHQHKLMADESIGDAKILTATLINAKLSRNQVRTFSRDIAHFAYAKRQEKTRLFQTLPNRT